MVQEESRERVDRISDLPEDLLHHVLSYLSFRQVAQTCMVSKTWEKACHTFPILQFDCDLFDRDICNFPILEYDSSLFDQQDMQYLTLFNRHYMHSDNELKAERRKRMFFYKYMLNYAEESLRNRYNEMVTIKKLALQFMNLTEIFSSVIDRCLGYALGCNVKELRIRLRYIDVPDYGPRKYILPQMVLCAESLHVLNISGAKLELPRNVKLSFLRKLSLCVLAAEGDIETIIAGCPLLEDLSLRNCQGFKSLKLFGLHKLNKVRAEEMRDLEMLEMKAFSVQAFSIVGSYIPRGIDITLCKNLNSLEFRRTSITDRWLCDHISKFPLLEYLYVDDCYTLTRIKISSFSLKGLHSYSCASLVEVKLETPNLSVFHYEGDIVSFSLDDFIILETTLCFFRKNGKDTKWYFKFIELFRKFYSLSKVLNLKSKRVRYQNVIFPMELRLPIPPIYCGVKHFNFIMEVSPPNFAIKYIVDGLLRISPHAKTLSIKVVNGYKFCVEFEFSYKKELTCEGDICECCKSLPILCWRQCMEKVEIKCTRKLQIKDYFLEGEEIWEMMDSIDDTILLWMH